MDSEKPTKRTRRTILKSASLSTIPVIGIASGATGTVAADSTIKEEEPHESKTYAIETSLDGAPYPYDESKQVSGITIAYYGTREAPYTGGDENDYQSIVRVLVNTVVLVRKTGDDWQELEINQDDPYVEQPVDWTLSLADLGVEMTATSGYISSENPDVGSSWGKGSEVPPPGEVAVELAKIALGEIPIVGGILTGQGILGAFESGSRDSTEQNKKVHYAWKYPLVGESIHTGYYTCSIYHPVVRGLMFDIDYNHNLPNDGANTNIDRTLSFSWYDMEYPDSPQIPR